MRAFVAAELSEPARRAAVELVRGLRAGPNGEAVRWVPAENLHVTLHFLGDVERERVPEIARCVRAETAGVAPFRLGLGAVGGFPAARRPRVVILALEPEEPLLRLAAAVGRGAAAAGFPPEDRPFRGHLTLGRVKRGRRFRLVTAPVTPVAEAFDVGEAVLFRSHLVRSGATYTPLERMALGGSSHPESHSLED